MRSHLTLGTAFSLLLLLTLGCATNGGIEAGNPDLKGKSITLTPEGREETYLLQFLDGGKVAVSQVKAGIFETISVNYFQDGTRVSLNGGFSDGTQIDVELLTDEQGNILEADLSINGQPTDSDFLSSEIEEPEEPEEAEEPEEPEETDDETVPGESNAALLLSGALCDRIVSCNTVFTPENCNTEVLTLPGLSHEFGDPQSQSLQESATAIEAGEKTVDAQALEECLAGIAMVSCEIVQKDFNDLDPPNYPQLRKIIPKPICSQGLLLAGEKP